jgi:cell division protein FtsW
MLSAAVAGVAILIKTAPYRMARLTIFLNPDADKSGAGYHINQALLAIGSGGLFGMGFGRSRQKFNYLPEAATDSIFAVISEELGLIRASFIILLFVLFAFRGYKIAKNAPDDYSRLMAVGITTWIVAQAFINILAILSMMPLTGVPLPFISLGGTSLIMLMFASGILLNISRHVTVEESNENSRVGRRHRRTHLAGLSRII